MFYNTLGKCTFIKALFRREGLEAKDGGHSVGFLKVTKIRSFFRI